MIWLLPSFPALAQNKQAALNQKLASEIDELFIKDIKAQTPDAATHARVRQILAKYGVPSNALVGSESVAEYLVLLSGEPLPFLETVLPKLKQAADGGKVSEDSYIYLQQIIRRKRMRKQFSGRPENPKLRDEIEGLVKADQGVRPAGQKNWDLKKMEEIDRADGIEVRAILAKYGLPTFALVGPRAAEGFADMIQHQPLALEKTVLPEMKTKAAEGQIDSEHYAMLIDRVESSSHEPQTYGENFVCTPDGKFEPSPIADAQNVEHLRAEFGLMPLAVYEKVLEESYGKNFCAQIAAQSKRQSAIDRRKPH